jgi:hypothetical protein
MNTLRNWIITAALLGYAAAASGYEIHTHSRMTWGSIVQSVLWTPEIFADLDIRNAPDAFGSQYYVILDPQSNNVEIREALVYETTQRRMPDILLVRPRSIDSWLIRGAIREDDYLIKAQDGVWRINGM